MILKAGKKNPLQKETKAQKGNSPSMMNSMMKIWMITHQFMMILMKMTTFKS